MERIPKSADSRFKKIELDNEECCALYESLAHNARVLGELSKMISPERLEKYTDILARTYAMGFDWNEEVAETYHALAYAELERLKKISADEPLKCGHSIGAHIQALESVLSKTEIVAN